MSSPNEPNNTPQTDETHAQTMREYLLAPEPGQIVGGAAIALALTVEGPAALRVAVGVVGAMYTYLTNRSSTNSDNHPE